MHHSIVVIFIYLQNVKLDTLLNKMDMVLPQGVAMLSDLPTPVSQNNLSRYSSLDLSASTPEGDKYMQKYLCQYETVLSHSCPSLSCCWCRLVERFSLSSVQKSSVKLILGYWPGTDREGKRLPWDCVGCLAQVVSTKKIVKKWWHYPGRRRALPSAKSTYFESETTVLFSKYVPHRLPKKKESLQKLSWLLAENWGWFLVAKE